MIALGMAFRGLQALDLQSLAQVSAGRLLNTVAEGVAVTALAWILLLAFGRQNSGTRFAVWFSALLAIVALPFFAGVESPLSAAHASQHAELVVSSSWAFYFVTGWAMISALLLLRLGIGLWRVRRLRSDCAEVDLAILDPALHETIQRCGVGRKVSICVSDWVRSPTAIGFLRPAIVFPAWALHDLSSEELKVILLHELAHLRRGDDWTNLIQKIVKALFFFHPAVWWIENRLGLEREMACDDAVLAHTANPKAYAASLISLAEKTRFARGLALAQAAVGRMRQTSRRIAQILDARRPNATQVWKPVVGLAAALSVAAWLAAPYAPHWVAFENRVPPLQSVAANATSPSDAPFVSTPSRTPGQIAPPKVVPARFELPQPTLKPFAQTALRRKRLLAQSEGGRRENKNTDASISEMLVVFQSVQYGPENSAVTTLCVWRVRSGVSWQGRETYILLNSL